MLQVGTILIITNFNAQLSELVSGFKGRPVFDFKVNDTVNYYLKLIRNYESLRLKILESDIPDLDKDNLLLSTGCTLSSLAQEIRENFNFYQNIDDRTRFVPASITGKRILYFANTCGLCNRLRTIGALQVISKQINCEFSFCWTEDRSCIGSPKWALQKQDLDNQYSSILLSDSLEYILNHFDSCLVIGHQANARRNYIRYGLPDHIAYDSYLRLYAKECQSLFNNFITGCDLNNEIDSYTNQLNILTDTNYLAVHIRRTDLVTEYRRIKYPELKFPVIEAYEQAIEKLSPNKTFFLSTDCADVKLRFKNKYGDLVFIIDGEHIKENHRQTSFNHALIDLALLSRSRLLLITPHSSFSEFAEVLNKDINTIDLNKGLEPIKNIYF